MNGGVRIADAESRPEVVNRKEPLVEEALGRARELAVVHRVRDEDRTGIGRHSCRMRQSEPPSGFRWAADLADPSQWSEPATPRVGLLERVRSGDEIVRGVLELLGCLTVHGAVINKIRDLRRELVGGISPRVWILLLQCLVELIELVPEILR